MGFTPRNDWRVFVEWYSDYDRADSLCGALLGKPPKAEEESVRYEILQWLYNYLYTMPETNKLSLNDDSVITFMNRVSADDTVAWSKVQEYYAARSREVEDKFASAAYTLVSAALLYRQGRDAEALSECQVSIQRASTLSLPRMAEIFMMTWCLVAYTIHSLTKSGVRENHMGDIMAFAMRVKTVFLHLERRISSISDGEERVWLYICSDMTTLLVEVGSFMAVAFDFIDILPRRITEIVQRLEQGTNGEWKVGDWVSAMTHL